jgi:hypothetical protein
MDGTAFAVRAERKSNCDAGRMQIPLRTVYNTTELHAKMLRLGCGDTGLARNGPNGSSYEDDPPLSRGRPLAGSSGVRRNKKTNDIVDRNATPPARLG